MSVAGPQSHHNAVIDYKDFWVRWPRSLPCASCSCDFVPGQHDAACCCSCACPPAPRPMLCYPLRPQPLCSAAFRGSDRTDRHGAWGLVLIAVRGPKPYACNPRHGGPFLEPGALMLEISGSCWLSEATKVFTLFVRSLRSHRRVAASRTTKTATTPPTAPPAHQGTVAWPNARSQASCIAPAPSSPLLSAYDHCSIVDHEQHCHLPVIGLHADALCLPWT